LATDTHDNLPYAKTKRYFKKLACLLCFNKIWVPAETHRTHAQALGFNLNDIYYNLYTAETKRFSQYYYKSQKIRKQFSKKFIYIGRYSDEKGVDLLLNAWNRLPHKMGWGLTMVGTGTLPKNVDTSDVEFLNYKQPSQMDNFFDKYTCAIFPSRYEPWCVTLHELCAAGFFIIASASIPSTNLFVRNNENGFLIEPNSISELVTAIYRVINFTPEEFHRSAERSVTLSECLTVDMALTTVVALSGVTRQ
jgi:glycosyltransferase involved in cell wall biosynthesis